MDSDIVEDWFHRRTSAWSDWDPDRLLEIKGGQTISVVIPARDEQATIGEIVTGIRKNLVEARPLVDELVVMDSDSTDRTAELAAASGARVHSSRSVQPGLGIHPGKGEALWKSLFVTAGELLVFIDADLTHWGPHFVSGLVGPLLDEPEVRLVKGFYDRTLDDSRGHSPKGGRVTELVARPLLNLYWPELSGVIQPLAGEWSIRRTTFESLNVPVGYGVETATLLDVWSESGLDAIAQVDLGSRAHSHQSVHDLGVMAAEVIATAARRSTRLATWASGPSAPNGGPGGPAVGPSAPNGGPGGADIARLWQFERAGAPQWTARSVPLMERPPARSVSEYLRRPQPFARRALRGS